MCVCTRWEDNHYAVDLGPNEIPAAMSSADSTFAKPPPPSNWASPAVQAEWAAAAAGFSTDDGANSGSNESGNDTGSNAAEAATKGRRRTTELVLKAGANEDEITEKKEENEEKYAKAESVAGYDVGPLLAFVVAEAGLYTCGGGPHGNPTEVGVVCCSHAASRLYQDAAFTVVVALSENPNHMDLQFFLKF
jgi:hypothetical protein